MYRKVLKQLALRLPALGRIISERDHLRQKCTDLGAGKNSGYCHCCRKETIFQIQGEWLRDQFVCLACFSIPRQRHIQYVLDNHFPGWEMKNIHESSPSNNLIARYCSSYSSSQYFEGLDGGSFVNGVRCENLESLTFSDCSFDIFITQDVFEHIFNPDRAAKEIMRVLKPGGAHIFTAPKHKNLTTTYPRARLIEGKIEHIKEANYHGSPIGDGKALVTWDYGDDFEDLINTWSNASTTTYMTRDKHLGLDGEYLEVFVTRKRFS